MILNTLNEHSFLKLNYEQTINEIKIKNDKSIIYDIKEYFESIDLEIRNSKWRKANGWIIHGTRQRQILTTHGLIIFMRTVYKNKFTKKYAILADPYLKIEKYEKISKDFKFKVLSVIEGGERQKDIIKMTNNFISQSSVSRIINYYDLKKEYENCINLSINNFSNDNQNFKYICDVTNQNNIYIDIDDTFTTLKCNNKKLNIELE
ncbi:UPF0236 family transposase-like protein [Spiroplasma endosymbiont of Labia minor]|uniref:UPF0236 family transposase-like protein n=1 Tax=Spiroplasma endosymbiont of Labia minor TaxID=3066305 RepID=UPI0030D0397E